MKKLINKIKSLDKGTIIRTIMQFAVYVNQFIAVLGLSSYADSKLYQWITFGLTLIVTIISYWYNNDWTNFSFVARDIFDMMKDGTIKPEEAEEFIAKYKKSTSEALENSDKYINNKGE